MLQNRVTVIGRGAVDFTGMETVNVNNRANIVNLADAAVFANGLQALADLGAALEDAAPLNAVLPGIADNTVTQLGAGIPPVTGGEVTLGRAMGIGEALERFEDDVVAFLAGGSRTVQDLKVYLTGRTLIDIPADPPSKAGDLALGDLTISVGTVTETVIWEGQVPMIALAFTLNATRTTNFDLDFGEDADSLGVVLEPEDARNLVALTTSMVFDFAIGIEGPLSDQFFVEAQSLAVDGTA